MTQETPAARYIIIEESFSGHCCFEYSIIDTSISVDADPYRKRCMCETFDKDNAETICNALNAQFKKK